MYLLVAECPESGLPEAQQFDAATQCEQMRKTLERSGWKNIATYERPATLTCNQLRDIMMLLMAVLAKSARDQLTEMGINPFPVPTGHVVDRV